MDDPGFTALSTRLRRRIDNAFDTIAGHASNMSNYSRGKHKLTQSSAFAEDTSPGGFLVEDAEDFNEYEVGTISIPLSSVPAALHLLGLPPDDEEVINVFRNAVSGWGASLDGSSNVSRNDWRAICAALLEAEDGGGSDDDSPSAQSEMAAVSGPEDDCGPDSDEYCMSIDSDSSEPGVPDEEYQVDTPTSHKPRNSTKSIASARLDVGQPSAKQRAGCREDFARFFPDVADAELDRQKIMIKDVTRIANLLKEKIKAEEVSTPYPSVFLVHGFFFQIIEMLEAFSTSPDKTMNLQDFERMMIATKLIR